MPDSLKPYTIHETKDILCTETLERFSGRHTPDMTMKLALGKLGFEYIPLPVGDENYNLVNPCDGLQTMSSQGMRIIRWLLNMRRKSGRFLS